MEALWTVSTAMLRERARRTRSVWVVALYGKGHVRIVKGGGRGGAIPKWVAHDEKSNV